jgi:hypothetical protein
MIRNLAMRGFLAHAAENLCCAGALVVDPSRSDGKRGFGMSNDWTIFVVVCSVVLLMRRFDRLGKQLEAVCANIKLELSPSEDRRREILSEWKQEKDEAAKEMRWQWIWGGIIGALLLGWYIITRN